MNEQLTVILFAAVIGLLKWWLGRSKEDQEPPVPDAEERTRKLMEALGVPEHAVPKTPAAPPRPKPKRVPQRPPVLQRPTPVVQKVGEIAKTEEAYHVGAPAAVAAITTPAPAAEPRALQDLTALLRDRQSLRSAFVLREILGPPRGLQS